MGHALDTTGTWHGQKTQKFIVSVVSLLKFHYDTTDLLPTWYRLVREQS